MEIPNENIIQIADVCVKKVICITVKKGSGKEKDPVRRACQYWDFEGNMLFEKDTYEE